MPLPSRSTSAGPPVVLDTALLLCSFLLPAAKELGLNPKPLHFKPFEYFDHTGCYVVTQRSNLFWSHWSNQWPANRPSEVSMVVAVLEEKPQTELNLPRVVELAAQHAKRG